MQVFLQLVCLQETFPPDSQVQLLHWLVHWSPTWWVYPCSSLHLQGLLVQSTSPLAVHLQLLSHSLLQVSPTCQGVREALQWNVHLMCVTLLVLALLGALILAALDHPSTQAAAAVALMLPPAKVIHTQGFKLFCPDKNLSPTWWVYPFWSLHALLHSFLWQATSPPYLHSHSLQSSFHRSPAYSTL